MIDPTKEEQVRTWLAESGITETIEITDHLVFLFDSNCVEAVKLNDDGTITAVFK